MERRDSRTADDRSRPTLSRSADKQELPTIRGYAAVFFRANDSNTEFPLWRNAVERVMVGAFDASLRRGFRALYNHSPDHLLGRTKAGTLKLTVDNVGLRYEVEPADTQVYRDVVEMLLPPLRAFPGVQKRGQGLPQEVRFRSAGERGEALGQEAQAQFAVGLPDPVRTGLDQLAKRVGRIHDRGARWCTVAMRRRFASPTFAARADCFVRVRHAIPTPKTKAEPPSAVRRWNVPDKH